MKILRRKARPDQKGFSLLETLVATGIFVIVVAMSVGLFISGINVQRKMYNLYYLQSEGNFLMQKMSKEIRMATTINADQANDNSSSFQFYNTNLYGADLVKYCRWSSAHNACLDSSPDDGTYVYLAVVRNGNPQIISSPDIKINSLLFYTSGTFVSTQPAITIVLRISGSSSQPDSLLLQNSLSARRYK